MRVGLVRKIGFTLVALGVVGLGGCNDDPLDFDEQTAVRMFTNPSFMVVQTGDSVQLVANGINAGNEPIFQPVTATVASCGGSGSISVIESDQQTSIQPPQIYEVIGGAALGGACVVVQSGSVTDTVDVVVVGGTLTVVTAPAQLVAGGAGGTVTVALVGVDGTPVTPFDPTDVAWSSDNSTVLSVDDAGGLTTTGPSGSATITAVWTGTDATGTSGQGVSLTATAAVTVVPDVPVSAVFSAMYPALGAGGQAAVAVFVADQFGNQVTDPAQVLSITVMSDDLAVATVSDNYDPEALGALAVTATGVGAGTADFSGFVTTSVTSADLPFGPTTVSVLDPIITAVPSSGPTATIAITGTGFVAAGFATTLLVDGETVGNFTVDSDIQITAEMPSFGTADDYDVVVDVGGIQSAAGTWTLTSGFSGDGVEPGNDGPNGGSFVSFPASFSGTLGTGGDTDDFFTFTLSADATIQFSMSWLPADGDLDLIQDDGGLGFTFPCGFPTATGSIPEGGACALTAGTYQLWVNDYAPDGITRTYTINGTIQ